MPKDCYSQPVQPNGKSMIKYDSKVSFLLVGCWFVQWCKLYLVICMAHMRVLLDWNSSTVILKVQWPTKLGTEREMRHPSNLSMLSLQSSEEVPQINNLVIGNISRCIPDVTLYNLTVLSEAPVTRVLSLKCQLRHSTLPKTWRKRCPLSWPNTSNMNVANSDSYSITFLACTAFFFSFPLYPQLIDFKHYNSTTIEFDFSVIMKIIRVLVCLIYFSLHLW